MHKITIARLARMSQREFLQIHQTIGEDLRSIRSEVGGLQETVRAIEARLENGLRALSDGLELLLAEVRNHHARHTTSRRPRPSRRPRHQTR